MPRNARRQVKLEQALDKELGNSSSRLGHSGNSAVGNPRGRHSGNSNGSSRSRPVPERKQASFPPKRSSHSGHSRGAHHRRDRDGSVAEDEAQAPNTSDMLAFERCLCDLVRLLTPSPSQIEDKMHVLKDVRVALSSIGFTADIYGSLCTGLLTPSSDMDCVVVPSPTAALHGNAQAVRQVMAPVLDSSAALGQQERKSRLAAGIRAVANAMRRSRDFNDVRAIVHARVPIVKCRHRAEGLGVDLSFEQDGCRSSFFLCNEFRKDENVLARSLIVLVKSLVSNEGLDDPSVGGLGSFPISLMVLWYIKSEVVKHYRENLRNNLAVVLVGVLKYYGDDLDFRRVGIDYVRAVTFQKPMSNELLIMNPIKAGSNCAAAASLFASRVVPLFSDAAAAFGELLTPSASMSRAEASLDRFYHNMMSRCDDYGRRGGREGHQQQQQHIWDKQTNVYVGGVLPAFYNH